MLARMLLLSLGGEFLFYCMAGLLLWRTTTLEPPQLVLLALATAAGVRALLVAFMFAVAWTYRTARSAELRLGPLAALRLFWKEYVAFLLLYTILQPLEPWLMRPRRQSPTPSRQPPVLLIHGYYCNAAFWWSTERYLRRHGVTALFTITLEPVTGDIDSYANQVAARAETICAQTGAARLVLVGHSMGGITARAYARRQGNRAAKVITLGSPHRGSIHTRFVLSKSPNIRQIEIQNPWLEDLNLVLLPTPITSIYSHHDNLIAPQNSAALSGSAVNNIALKGIGHLEMAFSRPVQALIQQEIQTGADELANEAATIEKYVSAQPLADSPKPSE